ncbi:MAG: hypothetical protein ACP5D7_13030 [Limnospira sp.]
MNYQDDPNVKRRLEDIEAEIGSSSQFQPPPADANLTARLKTFYGQFIVWFKELPKAGQIVVGVVGLAAVLALLKALVELISLAVSLAVVGVIVYIGYQLFKSSKSSKIR